MSEIENYSKQMEKMITKKNYSKQMENYRKQIGSLSENIISDEALDIAEILVLLNYMRECSEAGIRAFPQKEQEQLRRIMDFYF